MENLASGPEYPRQDRSRHGPWHERHSVESERNKDLDFGGRLRTAWCDGDPHTILETQIVIPTRLSAATAVSRRSVLRLAGTAGIVASVAACRRPGFLSRPEPTPEIKDLNLLVAEEYLFLLEFETLEGPWSEAYPHWPLVLHESDLDGLFNQASQAAADGSGAYDGILPIPMPTETQNWLDFDLIQPWDAHLEEGGLPGADRIVEGLDLPVREAARARGQQMGLPINVSSIALAWLNAPLEAAGVTDPPVTWDDTMLAAQAIKQSSSLIPFDRAFSPLSDLVAMIWSGEENPYTSDDHIKWDGEVALLALTWLQEMVLLDLMPENERGFGMWMQGRTAIMTSVDLHGAVANTFQGAGNADFAATGSNMRLQRDSAKAGTPFWSNCMGLARGARNIEGAAAFGVWWLGPDNIALQRRIADVAPKPAYRYVYEHELMADAKYDWQRAAMDTVRASVPLRPSTTFEQELAVVSSWMEEALDPAGYVPAQDALATAAREAREVRGGAGS